MAGERDVCVADGAVVFGVLGRGGVRTQVVGTDISKEEQKV